MNEKLEGLRELKAAAEAARDEEERDELFRSFSLQRHEYASAADLSFYPSDLRVVEENGQCRADNIRTEVQARREAALDAAGL